jgi:hypothetical protein
LIDEHAITTNVAKVFGNDKTFKCNNPLLIEEAQKEIETIYWKINGTSHIIYNKLMVWFVKGWLT